MGLRAVAAFAAAVLIAAGCQAAEVGCDKLKWPAEPDRTQLLRADKPTAVSGATLDSLPSAGLRVSLQPYDRITFEQSPEKPPKPGTYAALLRLSKLPEAGIYRVTLDGDAWIDVVQAGQRMKSIDFSGVRGCAGLRKSVKFKLESLPATIQLSNAEGDALGIVVAGPAPP